MNKTLTAILSMSLLAVPLMPSAAADAEPYDEHRTATGPVSITVEKDIGLGLSVCFTDSTFQVAPCAPNPGGVSSLGGAFFFVDDDPQSQGDWNADASYDDTTYVGREVRVWVELAAGSVSNGGFSVLACTDGDDDDICEGGNPVDVLVEAYAGNGDDPCDGSYDKDTKDCDSPNEAELYFCARRDDWTGDVIMDDGTIVTVTDRAFDDFVVFIGAWEDTTLIDNPNNNNGVGGSVGSFDIYAEYRDFLGEADCDAANSRPVGDVRRVDTVLPPPPPSTPTYAPSLGSITITVAPGSVIVTIDSFDEMGWACTTSFTMGINVVCEAPQPPPGSAGWKCWLLSVTAEATTADSQVNGTTGCYKANGVGNTQSTDIVSGPNGKATVGVPDIYNIVRIECHATSGVGSYTVTCTEP